MKHSKLLDGAAIGAAFLCLVHCIGLPMAFALLPALATMGAPSTEWLHVVLLLTAVPLSGLALVGGYRAHGRIVPVVTGGFGLAALAAGVGFASAPAVETALTVMGSFLLAAAHIGNWRRMRIA